MTTRLIVDSELCTGCRRCQIACSFRHFGIYSPALSRVRVSNDEIGGQSLPVVCCFCEEQYCVKACPTEAIDANTGVIDTERCINCLACVQACPSGGATWEQTRELILKCDLCGGDPECVKACPTNALKVVPLNLSTIYHVRKYQQQVKDLVSKGDLVT